jgi:hypothetical protein
MPTWYCASASPLLANASIALKVSVSLAWPGLEKIKKHEKARAINFMFNFPQLGSNGLYLGSLEGKASSTLTNG